MQDKRNSRSTVKCIVINRTIISTKMVISFIILSTFLILRRAERF
jgi:hypothetical protein